MRSAPCDQATRRPGDQATKYRIVSDVVKIAQAQGMRKVGFVAIKER